MRRNARLMNPSTSFHSMFNFFGDNEKVIGIVIASGSIGSKDDSFDTRRETRRKELLRRHVEIAAYAPRTSTHFELVLKVVKDHPIDRASALFTMLKVHGKAHKAPSNDATYTGDANAMGNPIVHEGRSEVDLVPSAPA